MFLTHVLAFPKPVCPAVARPRLFAHPLITDAQLRGLLPTVRERDELRAVNRSKGSGASGGSSEMTLGEAEPRAPGHAGSSSPGGRLVMVFRSWWRVVGGYFSGCGIKVSLRGVHT